MTLTGQGSQVFLVMPHVTKSSLTFHFSVSWGSPVSGVEILGEKGLEAGQLAAGTQWSAYTHTVSTPPSVYNS